MNESTLTISPFTRTMKIGIIAVLIILLCIAPAVASIVPEPSPGWKYRGEWNNSGLYDDGGYRPNGLELWNVSDITQPAAGIGIIESTPAVANGIVYVGDNDQHLFAIFANNGSIKWRNTLACSVYSSPAVANGIVYVGTGDSWYTPCKFYAFNADTGGSNIPVWFKDSNPAHGGILGGFDSSPTVYNGNVYVGRDDFNVSAWNAATGAEVWRFQTADSVTSSPAVSDGVVYFSTVDNNIFAVDANSGAKIWDAANGTGWNPSDHFVNVGSSPAVANGTVYIGGEYNVYAFFANNGTQRSDIFNDDDAYFSGSPAVVNGIVYIGTGSGPADNVFYALDANDISTAKWMNVTPDNSDMYASPAVANGVVYVISEGTPGHLYAWNAANGDPLWDFNIPSYGTESSPAVANGVVYFGTWTNGLIAVGSENTASVTDIGVFRGNEWILDYSMDFPSNHIIDRRYQFGISTDKPVVGDFNNDGVTDIGVFRGNEWIIDYSMNFPSNHIIDRRYQFGISTDKPVVGDFNNDGVTDIGVFRGNEWIIDYSMDFPSNHIIDRRYQFGISTDKPVVGDFNNDGVTDIGVFRGNEWIIDYSMDFPSNHIIDRRYQFGISTDKPVVGDFNNDGVTDIGVFRGNEWVFDYSMNFPSNHIIDRRYQFGIPTDQPVVGNFDNA